MVRSGLPSRVPRLPSVPPMTLSPHLLNLPSPGTPPAALRAYRLALMSMESGRWRLAHYGLLRAFVLRGEWQQAAAWMGQAAKQLRGKAQQLQDGI